MNVNLSREDRQKHRGEMHKIPAQKAERPPGPLRAGDGRSAPGGDLLHAVQIGAQLFGDDDAAVRLLELLDDGGHQAAGGKTGAVERVHELQFLRLVAAEADVAAAGLIVARVGDGGALLVLVHAGDPQLDVVGGGHGGGAVARGQLGKAVVQPQASTRRQALPMSSSSILPLSSGRGVAEHLHLVELVAADHAALAGAVGAGLAAVAGRVGKQLLGQLVLGEYLAAVEVDQRRLRRGQQEAEAFFRKAIDVVFKLGELAGGEAAIVGEQVRRQHEGVAVLEVLGDK